MSWSRHGPALVAFLDRERTCARRRDLGARFGRRALDWAVGNGEVVEILPRVFAAAARASEFGTRVAALRMWLPRDAAISGLAALHLRGLTDAAPDRISVVVPRARRVRAPVWVRVVRTDAAKTVQQVGQARCTTRARALADAWAEVAPERRIGVALEAMRRSTMTGDEVIRVLAHMPRVPARRKFVALLDMARRGIESYLEAVADRTVLNTKDLRSLPRQVAFTALGSEFRVDVYDAATRTVIEFDGAKVHGSHAAKRRDNARDAALATRGNLTLRFGYEDVMTRPTWCREVIRATLAARAPGGVEAA